MTSAAVLAGFQPEFELFRSISRSNKVCPLTLTTRLPFKGASTLTWGGLSGYSGGNVIPTWSIKFLTHHSSVENLTAIEKIII
eukprot:UN33622